jgi:hypothetical protein
LTPLYRAVVVLQSSNETEHFFGYGWAMAEIISQLAANSPNPFLVSHVCHSEGHLIFVRASGWGSWAIACHSQEMGSGRRFLDHPFGGVFWASQLDEGSASSMY